MTRGYTLLGGRVAITEPEGALAATTDTLLLAAAVPARAGELALDIGCGVGAAALCLARRVPGVHVVGVDRDATLVRMARANARRNGAVDRVRFKVGVVGGRWPAALGPGSADHVLTNPPYLPPQRAARTRRSAATVEDPDVGLARWVEHCLALVRPGGTLTAIQRADRLDDVLAALAGRAGSIVVFPLWPRDGAAAKRVLVRARPGRRAPLVLAHGMVLHRADGRYTEAAEAILRDGAALDLAGPLG